MSERGNLLCVRGLRKRHGHRELLRGLDFDLSAHDCVLLTGENGAGKSTLLRILAGLERPDGGAFSLAGAPALPWRRARKALGRTILYLHQQPWMFDGSVAYNLGYGLRGSRRSRRARIREALAWIEMEAFADTPARTLSGGERQRIALARAWLRQPAVMLLDEPTANLDRDARQRTLALLHRLHQEGMTLVIASHDPDHFGGLIRRHLHLDGGRLGEQPVPGGPPVRLVGGGEPA